MGGGQISNASLATGAAPLAGKTILHDEAVVIGSGSETLRTVGGTYYLLACGMTQYSTSNHAITKIEAGSGRYILAMYTSVTATYQPEYFNTKVMNFAYPLPVTGGTVITVNTNAGNGLVMGWIIGWQE